MHGDVISYPSALVDLKIESWHKEPTVALVPDVPVDVLLDYSSMAEWSLVTTRAPKNKR